MSPENIKALWIASWYPHPGQPTLGIFTRREAEAVSKYCDVAVVHAEVHACTNYLIEEKLHPTGFREVLVYYPSSKTYLQPVTMLWAYFKGVNHLKSQGFVPDFIHLHVLSLAGMVAWYYHNKQRIPLFISEHWSGYSEKNPEINWFKSWLSKRLTQQASAVFTVTQAMAVSMQRLGFGGQYIINPNVVDTNFCVPKKSNQIGDYFHFIHVSNLDDNHKNISGLLRATKNVAQQRQGFKLIIIGGDEGTEHLEKLIEELSLNNLVEVAGVQPHNVVIQRMQESDAFVLFSNREGLPCVLLEAMAVGLPVISSAIPGLEDWVTEQTGILVQIGDEKALSEAMVMMLNKIMTYDKEKIRNQIVRKCSYPIVGQKIVNAYEEALAADFKKRS